MTSDKVLIDIQNAGKNASIELPEDSSAQLDVGQADITALGFGDNGELIISLQNGNEVSVANFEDFTNAGNFVYLSDGTLLDFSTFVAAPAQDTLTDSFDGKAVERDGSNDNQYICELDPSHEIRINDEGEMIVVLADGTELSMDEYFQSVSEGMGIADGTVVDGDELLVDAEDLSEIETAAGKETTEKEEIDPNDAFVIAEELAALEPEAGEDAGGANGNSGYGFNSSAVEVPLNSPDAIGPLGPTQLRYVAPEVNKELVFVENDDNPILSAEDALLDETNLVSGDLVATGKINVDFGGDGPGTITGNGDFCSFL